MLVYIGGKEGNKHADKKEGKGRVPVGKQPVLGIKQRWTCEVRAVPVDFRSGLTVSADLSAAVEPGTKVFTDDRFAYRHIDRLPYTHRNVKPA